MTKEEQIELALIARDCYSVIETGLYKANLETNTLLGWE